MRPNTKTSGSSVYSAVCCVLIEGAASCREVLSKIQTKLRERTGQSMGPLERIFHWFGTGSTCTPSMLREALLKTGVVLTDTELQTLFSCIDDDGSGTVGCTHVLLHLCCWLRAVHDGLVCVGALDLHELCRNLSEEDYPGGPDNYHWVKVSAPQPRTRLNIPLGSDATKWMQLIGQ